jgi:hypothetical protein
MKNTMSNKDTNYSLNISENYKKELECDVSDVTKKYTALIVDYFNFILENIKISNINFEKFIIIRGLDTITNVFLHLLYYTKNIDLTYFHCQKSFYFYVEFVGQISDDEKMFLQLTSRDATTYVYKKTLFDINNEFKKQNELITDEFKEKLNIINIYVHLYQTYLLKIIKTENFITKEVYSKNISYIIKLFDKLNHLHNKTEIYILENITEKLFLLIEDADKFVELNSLIVKKFIKNPSKFKNSHKFKKSIKMTENSKKNISQI